MNRLTYAKWRFHLREVVAGNSLNHKLKPLLGSLSTELGLDLLV
jgi:hypothetical protein